MTRITETDALAEAWTHLRAFVSEGTPALDRALEALRRAEPAVRASPDPSHLALWLLASATALQHTRRPEAMEAAMVRARELVNLVARTRGEAASIPDRTRVEAIARDLADVVPAQREAAVRAGLTYSARTVRLARAAGRDDWLAAALASQADLVLRAAGRDRRRIRRAVALHEEARRRWPARDPEGRAGAALGYADALLAAGEWARAEAVAREAVGVFAAAGNRYHEAGGRLRLAKALAAADRDEALDEQAAAVALYRELRCAWERRQAEMALD